MRLRPLCALLVAAATLPACGSTAAFPSAGPDGERAPFAVTDGGEEWSVGAPPSGSTSSADTGGVLDAGDPDTRSPGAALPAATHDPAGGVQPSANARPDESSAGQHASTNDPGPAPPPPTAAVTAPGVTQDEIRVGLFRNKNLQAVHASIGVITGDVDGWKQALIDDLNARGRIGGRRVVPVWHEVDNAADESEATRAQAACTAFTQDNDVFAVLGFQLPDEVYLECLQRAGVTAVIASLSHADERTFEHFPHYYEVQTVNLTRLARLKVTQLHAEGFFTPGTRLGLVRYDTPRHRRAITDGLLPGLAARGLRLDKEFALPRPENLREHLSQQAAVSNAVLQFKTVGIDRVIFLTWGAWTPVQFMMAAQEQDYHPRYGLDTHDEPLDIETRVPEQLHGAVGFGWSPLVDVSRPADPGPSPSRQRCLSVLAARGHKAPDRSNESTMTALCDAVWFFETGAKRAHILTTEGFREAVDSLGSAYESAGTERTHFGPGRHDGAAAYRRLFFSDDCGCFNYGGPPVAMD